MQKIDISSKIDPVVRPFCGDPVRQPIGNTEEGSLFGFCPSDQTPHHLWCWNINGGCTTLNCSSNRGQNPSGDRPLLLNLQPCISEEERAIRRLIQQLAQAIEADDDTLIESIWEHEGKILLALTDVKGGIKRVLPQFV